MGLHDLEALPLVPMCGLVVCILHILGGAGLGPLSHSCDITTASAGDPPIGAWH